MNDIELTELFVEYSKTQQRLAILESAIQTEVLKRADSQKIAGVKATYYQAGIEYDYEAAAKAKGVTDALIAEHATVKVTPRWKEIADVVQADVAKFAVEKPARVVVKV